MAETTYTSRHSCYYREPKYASYDQSSWLRGRSRQSSHSLERPGRAHSSDSAYSRSDNDLYESNDRLTSPPHSSSVSHMTRTPKPPSYDRMVCDAVARLKSKKGSSIRDIAKNLKHKYASGLKSNNAAKVGSTAKRLVREGKLVKDGNLYRLKKSKDRTEDDSDDDTGPRRKRSRSYSGAAGKSPSPYTLRRHRHGRRRRSRRRRRRRGRRRHRSRSRSRSRSRHRRRRRHRRSKSRRRRRRRGHRRRRRNGRKKAIGGSALRRNLSRGRRRKKSGSRKARTKLSYTRKHPHQRKYTRSKRRAKHSYRGRAKPESLPADNSKGGQGWFGGWFRKGGGEKGAAGSGSGGGGGGGSGSNSASKGGARDKQDTK